ncbi:hypothetical protein H6P81_001096 [Aristolochia fimbriata]|uniref:Remorin C-terminal domain-containing protein n=1 Tax=Aristolochia fimbriata TaxID=158543 RepID=A0AAV7FAI6_ARIFI|nr:hypothetical protein H6P81_001096 [Aristolochia fimbriata]
MRSRSGSEISAKIMGEETSKKKHVKPMKYEVEEKMVVPRPSAEEFGDFVSTNPVQEAPEAKKTAEKTSKGDSPSAWNQPETRISVINAWVEFKKTKAEIEANKKLSNIQMWERMKITSKKDRLKQIKANLEAKKSKVFGNIENKMDIIHKVADEKRLMVDAERHEKHFKAEKMGAKYRATAFAPKKIVGCFGGY